MHFVYRIHAVERMFERNIDVSAVEEVVQKGLVIESYPDDKPYPSYLALGFEANDTLKPLHVVYARNDEEIIVITVYRPDPAKWSDDYTRRKL